MIATIRFETEIKGVLCNNLRKLPVTTGKNKAKTNKYITEKKKQTNDQQYRKIDGEKIFSICDGILMYGEKNIKRVSYRSSWHSEDESFNEKQWFLAKYGQRNKRKYKILQRLCDSGKDTTIRLTGRKIYKHFQASMKKVGRKRIRWRYPTILKGIWSDTKPKYAFRIVTSGVDFREKNKICVR